MNILNPIQPETSKRTEALAPLLDTAETRLRRQSRYARPLAKGGPRAAGIEDLLKHASACVTALAGPTSTVMPVQAQDAGDCVRIADSIEIDSPDLAKDLASGGMLSIYVLSLGFDQSLAFD